MSEQNRKTRFIQAHSSLWVPGICALNPLFCTERCMWGVWWGTGEVDYSTFSIFLPFLRLQSNFLCPFCLELGSTLTLPTLISDTTEASAMQPGAIPLCLRLRDTAQLALPTTGFSTATRKVWKGRVPQPGHLFRLAAPRMYWGLRGTTGSCKLLWSLRGAEVVHQNLLCRISAPSAPLRPHGGGQGTLCKAARCPGGGQGSAAATAAVSTEQPLWECHALPGPDPPIANQDPAVLNELHQTDIMVKLRQLGMGMINWKLSLTKGNSCCKFQALTLN